MLYIYVLKLEDHKYYIGKSNNIKKRILQHFESNGSEWTRLYKPLKVHKIYEDCDDFDEDKYTIMYMEEYGIMNVRGGSFCQVKLDEESIRIIKKMIRGSTDKCFICGSHNHFINNCYYKDTYYEKNKHTNHLTMKCYRCEKKGHHFKDCYSTAYPDGTYINDDKIKCTRCKRFGHNHRDCFSKTSVDGKYLYDYSDSDSNDDIYCTRCKRFGHYNEDCYSTKYSNGRIIKKSSDIYCSRCERNGHSSYECYSVTYSNGEYINRKKLPRFTNEELLEQGRCTKCFHKGHNNDDCHATRNYYGEFISQTLTEEKCEELLDILEPVTNNNDNDNYVIYVDDINDLEFSVNDKPTNITNNTLTDNTLTEETLTNNMLTNNTLTDNTLTKEKLTEEKLTSNELNNKITELVEENNLINNLDQDKLNYILQYLKKVIVIMENKTNELSMLA
jgi:hypothetical protein